MTAVYLVDHDDIERYQLLYYDLPESELTAELLRFNGTPRAATWPAPPVYVPEPRLERPDLWRLGTVATFAATLDVHLALEPFSARAGELLPLVLDKSAEPLFALNILVDIDCLRSDAVSLDDLVIRPDFIEHRLPETGLFKVPELDRSRMFYVEHDGDESLITRIHEAGLVGLVFERIWTSVAGPERKSLLF